MMSQIDLSNLLQKLGLEVTEPKSPNNTDPKLVANPFMRRRRSRSLSSINFTFPKSAEVADQSITAIDSCIKKCTYESVKHTTIFKRPKKPQVEVNLKWIIDKDKFHSLIKGERLPSFGSCCKHKDLNFRRLNLDYQTSTASLNTEPEINDLCVSLLTEPNFGTGRVRSVGHSSRSHFEQQRENNSNRVTCSHQARMNPVTPCDVTIDELASYFETFVHIPKKMSSMAEMMYI